MKRLIITPLSRALLLCLLTGSPLATCLLEAQPSAPPPPPPAGTADIDSGRTPPRPGTLRPEQLEVKAKLGNLRERLQDLQASGKTEEAQQVKRQIAELMAQTRDRAIEARQARLEQELAQLRAQMRQIRLTPLVGERPGVVGPMREPPLNPAPRLRPPQRFAVPTEAFPRPEQRLEHLRIAIENLHAAGLHEQANALAAEAEGIERGVGQRQGPAPNGPDQLQRVVRELRDEVQQLRQSLQEARRRLDELSEKR